MSYEYSSVEASLPQHATEKRNGKVHAAVNHTGEAHHDLVDSSRLVA